MPSVRSLVRLLAAILAVSPVLRAQTNVLKETFTGTSTIGSNPVSPVSASPSGVAYQQLSAKTWTPNPASLTSGSLRFGIVSTTSGFNHIQALFTNYPVSLDQVGDYLQLAVTFEAESGIITPQANSTLFFGLHNAGQVQPIPGGMHGNVSTATAGYAQTWQGYVNRIFHTGGNNGFYTRPAQGAGSSNNQDVLYNYPGASVVGSTSPSSLTAFPANSTYTAIFRITRHSATSLRLSSSLYSGTSEAGSPLYTQTSTSSNILTSVFDAFAIGWRATGSQPSIMEVSSISITTTGTTTIIPEITTQPFSLTKSVGDAVELAVVADGGRGTPLAYQWYKDGNPIDGATQPTFHLASAALADAGDYTVRVTNVAGSTTSDVATLTVTTGAVPPSIVTEPAGATILVGGTHTFTAMVNGTSPLAFEWQHSTDGGATYQPIAGATDATFVLTDAAVADAGWYRLVVTNAQGAATTAPAELLVQEAPAIVTPPSGAALAPGGSHTLTVVGSGTPAPTFQWRRNGADLPGATDASYTISNADGSAAGNYTVVLANVVGSVTSAPAPVTVLSPTLAITAATPAAGSVRNPDTRLTLTFNEPVTPGVSGVLRIHDADTGTVVDQIDLVEAIARRDLLRTSSTLSTQPWPVQTKLIGGIPNAFNYYPITVAGTTATIYPRNNVLSYGKTYYVTIEPGVFVNAAGETFGGIADSGSWRFSTGPAAPAAGTTELVVAADGTGDFDTLQAALDFIPANNTTPTIIRVRKGTYFEEIGFQAKHFVTIVGEDADQTVITYPNNNTFNNVSGVYHRAVLVAQSVHDFTIANLTIINSTPQNGSQAEAIVINGSSAIAGRNVVTGCKFFSYQDTVQFNKQTYISDCTISGDVDFLWGDGPAYFENCDIRILRSGAYFTQIRNGSGNHGYVFRHCRFTAPAGITGTFFGRIDPAGFPYSEVVILDSIIGDAVNNDFLSTVTGASGSSYRAGWWLLNNAGSAAAAGNLHNWSHGNVDGAGNPLSDPNGDAFTDMPTDATTLANYRDPVWVLNTNLAGTMNGSWTPALAPLIAAPPVSAAVDLGQPVVFKVAAIGIPHVAYQWTKNGSDIAGATGATLVLPATTANDDGVYRVVLTNTAGVVVSDPVTLTLNGVILPPTITTHPTTQLIPEGATGTLSVMAVGTEPLTYQWYKGADTLLGATTASYTITNATSADAGDYRVVVSNGGGSVPSDVAVVTVKGVGAIARTGFAAGVTGGAGGPTVMVSTAADLKSHAESNTPAIIVVHGTIDLGPSGRIKLQSNKTLRGATTSATILGSVNISNVTNVIVSNLNISADTGGPGDNDGVTIANSTNVLVTKCTIFDSTDGNLDVINGSDLVTVSWCKFYYTRNNGHNFSNLVGSSDTDTGSGDGRTNYRVTWHHNWWSTGAKQRMIACRFGQSHMYNNYWDCTGNDYCTETRNLAQIFSEHNYYDTVKNPLDRRDALPTDLGLLMTLGNIFESCTGSQLSASDHVFTPPYSYLLDANTAVPEIVMAGAGNTTTDAPQIGTASVEASRAVPALGEALSLTAAASGFMPVSYAWRRNNLPLPGATGATLTFAALQADDAGVYTAVLGLADGTAVVSAPFALAVAVPPAIQTPPASATVTVGETVSFHVTATGDAPLAYQWTHDGDAIGGATDSALTLSAVTTAAAGEYRCVVSNAAGAATTPPAVLTVNKALAVVTVADGTATYDGNAHAATITTTPPSLPLVVTYNGGASLPMNAGTYTVEATVNHPDYEGNATGTLTINPASAEVTLSNLVHTYDGSTKTATASTAPGGLAVTLTYDGASAPPVAAGSYAVVATIVDPNYTGLASGILVISKAGATIELAPLVQRYDGTPRLVQATTLPEGLAVTLTYNGAAEPPVYPGAHRVTATIQDANFAGTTTETLLVTVGALVRHAPTLNGDVEGSIQVLLPESLTLNGGAMIAGDLLLPGTPTVRVNGPATFVGTRDAGGAAEPTSHLVTLNGGAVLRYLVQRVDPILLPVAPTPAAPAGRRDVVLTRTSGSLGDPTTVRNLTLNGGPGTVILPPGNYGAVTVNGGTRLLLGQSGDTNSALYSMQSLAVNGGGVIELAGPVVLTVAKNVMINAGSANAGNHPEWLVLNVAEGGLTLNGTARLGGTVVAPKGSVNLNGNAVLTGSVAADRLVLNGNAVLQEVP